MTFHVLSNFICSPTKIFTILSGIIFAVIVKDIILEKIQLKISISNFPELVLSYYN